MTSEEAIKIAIHCLGVQAEREVCEECDIYSNCHTDCKDAAGVAIEALKEVQQYREIGTVKECRKLASIVNKAERDELDKIMDEWLKYSKIGTVEECHEAVEKQTPKAPDYEGDGYDNKGELIYDTWICPNCGEKYEVDYDDYEHCPKCGQAIQWENLEGMEDGRY